MSRTAPSPPLVVVDVDYRQGAFELVMINIGEQVAHDVTVKFSRKIIGAEGRALSSLPIFERLRTLRPNKEIRIFVDSSNALFRRRKVNTFGATVRWRDGAGSEHKASYRHDLDAYRSMPERVTGNRDDA